MSDKPATSVNLLTVAGIAAVAYVVTTLAHEGGGHGAMCVAVGGHPVGWGAYYFDCDTRGLPEWTRRAIAAAGSTVNLILCGAFSLLLSADLKRSGGLKRSGNHGAWTVFLWLMAAINGYTWAGYFFFSGVAGIGDWGVAPDAFLYQLPQQTIIRIVMATAGMGLYLLLVKAMGRFMMRIVGSDRLDLVRRISWTAYGAGGIVALLIGLMNPVGLVIVLISSLASSLGGTSGLYWGIYWMRPKAPVEGVSFTLGLNLPWIVAGVVSAGVYAAVFGPTLRFH